MRRHFNAPESRTRGRGQKCRSGVKPVTTRFFRHSVTIYMHAAAQELQHHGRGAPSLLTRCPQHASGIPCRRTSLFFPNKLVSRKRNIRHIGTWKLTHKHGKQCQRTVRVGGGRKCETSSRSLCSSRGQGFPGKLGRADQFLKDLIHKKDQKSHRGQDRSQPGFSVTT